MGLWVGSLGMAGATAAIVFPEMRALEPTLGAYPLYTEPHWRLAAGHIAAKVFFASDLVQLVCAPLAGMALALLVLRKRVAWPSRLIAGRLFVLTLLMALLSYRFFVLAPRMDRELSLYRAAAIAGDTARAETHQAAFNADHPTASRVMSATFALAFVAFSLGAWSASTGPASAGPAAAAGRAGPRRGRGGSHG